MNEKDNEILELTELLEEDFEEMEGVEDFAPEEPFDVEELDSELDQMLHENGQKSGVRDDDINLDTLFDEEEEILELKQEDAAPVQDVTDAQEAVEIDLELTDEDEQEQVVETTQKPDLPQQVKDIDDLPDEKPTDEPAAITEAPEVTAPAATKTEEARTPETPEPTKATVAGSPDKSGLVADLRQEIAELQETVTALKTELTELHSGLNEKIQAIIQTNASATEDAGQNQKMQEQCESLESRLQQLDTDFATRLQQLETQQADQKELKGLKNRLATLESKAGEKIDTEAIQSSLQDFITRQIPATVANMLREEIAALTQQLGK